MSKLKTNIFNKIKNKKTINKDNNSVDSVSASSMTFMFLIPFIFVIILNKYINIEKKYFIILIIFSLICGLYNVYITINELYNNEDKKND